MLPAAVVNSLGDSAVPRIPTDNVTELVGEQAFPRRHVALRRVAVANDDYPATDSERLPGMGAYPRTQALVAIAALELYVAPRATPLEHLQEGRTSDAALELRVIDHLADRVPSCCQGCLFLVTTPVERD